MKMSYVPPHIAPLARPIGAMSALRMTLKCAVSTWTEDVYTQDFHRPRVPNLLYVMKPEAIRAMLVDHVERFPLSRASHNSLRPIWRTGLAVSEGADWRRQRQATAAFFTPRSVQSAIPIAEHAARLLCVKWKTACGPVELTSDISQAMSAVIWEATLGVSPDDPQFLAHTDASRQLLEDMQPLNIADILGLPVWMRRFCGPTGDRAATELRRRVEVHLKANPDTPDKTLRACLEKAVDAQGNPVMDTGQIHDNLVGMLAAGGETTALAASWALWLIAHCQTTAELIEREMAAAALDGPLQPGDMVKFPFLKAVVMEALRLFPPAHQIVRHCAATTDLGGETARKGDTVLIPIYAIHRRQDSWHEPMAFNPGRFLGDQVNPQLLRQRYLPFGAGSRICSGMHMALVEIQTVVTTVLRLARVQPDPHEAAVTLDAGFTLRPAHGLKVQLDWRCD